MSDNTALIAALRRKATFFRRFADMGKNETELLLIGAADALTEQDAVIEAVRKWRDWTCNLLLDDGRPQINWAVIDAIVPRTDSTSTEGTQ